MEKTIWRMGHILSMLGFIDQACIFRHLAARWDQPDCDGKTQALAALDSLPKSCPQWPNVSATLSQKNTKRRV